MLRVFGRASTISNSKPVRWIKSQKSKGNLVAILGLIIILLLSLIPPPRVKAAIAFDANLGQSFDTTDSVTHTHTTSAAAAFGSTIIIAFRAFSTNNAATVTVTGGSLTWTVDNTVQKTVAGDRDNLYIVSAYAPAGLASSSVITFTTNVSVIDATTTATSFTGIAINNRVDQINGQWQTTSSSSWNSGNITTNNADDLLFGAAYFDLSSNCTFTPGGSFNEIHDYASAGGNSSTTIYQIVSSTGTYAASGTCSASSSSRGQAVVAYKATGGTQSYVGSFTVPASTGNQAVTGVGFQPKAILLFANSRSSDGSSSNGSQNLEATMNILGMATSSSARATIYTTDDFTSGNPAYIGTQVLHVENQGGTAFIADFVSMDADGFTLNFTTANATAYVVNYMALGGSNLSANIKSFTSPGSTGNQAQTGVGFQPEAMILIGGIVGASQTSSRGMGFVSGTSSQVANTSNFGGGGAGGNARYQRVNQAYVQNNGNVKVNEATLASFDSDGFTLNYTTATAGSSISALCLKGGQFKAGSFTQKTSTGTDAITGVGFAPHGLLLSTVANTASTSINTGADIVQAVGASDGTHDAVVNSSGSSSLGRTTLDRTKIYKAIADDATPTIQAAAELQSFDSNGFTLNYTTADATAREIIYLAFGPPFGSTTDVIDDFNRANGSINGSTASSGETWGLTWFAQVSGQISSNQLATSGTNFAANHIDSTTYGPNVEAYVTIANNGGVGAGAELLLLMARLTTPTLNSASGYAVLVEGGTASNVEFYKIDNSSQTPLCSPLTQNPTPAAGDKVGLSVTGTTNPTLEIWYDSGGGWVSKGTCTDTGAAAKYQGAGNIGIEVGNDADIRLDDFGGGTILPDTPNLTPAAPTLNSPTSGATGVSTTPQFQMRTTDADNDYLRYKIDVCSNSDCSSIIRTIDQTSSQTGWSGQDQQTSTAYTGSSTIGSSTMATHTYQTPALSAGTQYWWRGYAIDPGGSNTFSSASSIFSFTTNQAPATPTLISPAASATAVAYKPIFQLRTTDTERDYLQYFIQIYTATACGGSQVGSDIDQTASQTGWQAQDQQSATAYTGFSSIAGSSVARYQYSGTSLNPNQTYSWRAKAIDPGGSNTFSSLTSCQDFTTGTTETRIEGGTQINGGTTLQ